MVAVQFLRVSSTCQRVSATIDSANFRAYYLNKNSTPISLGARLSALGDRVTLIEENKTWRKLPACRPTDQIVELPVVVGSEGEKALDIAKLRAETGYIALDPGYGNTGSCQSDITFIDGDAGILRYRGYAIEDLAEYSRFIEVAHLLIWGELPNAAQLDEFSALLTKHQMLREEAKATLQPLST